MAQTAVSITPNMILYQDGRLYNIKTNKFKKWAKDINGYMKTQIWVSGVSKNVSQHRLIAQYFIDNPKSKKQVNHKNGVKHDNRIENLEWATQSENAKHSFANGLQKVTRPCKRVKDLNTGEIFESVTEAAKCLKMNRTSLSRMLNNSRENKTTLIIYGK